MSSMEPVRLKKMPKEPLQIVCCLIFDPNNRLLLLRRHAEDLGGGLWATPGGRQDQGEDSAITAVRETKEETGLTVNDILPLGTHELRMPHGVAHMKTYKAHIPKAIDVVINPEEHDAHQWFNIHGLVGEENIIWGLPTTLYDFGLIKSLDTDPTLADGSQAILIERIGI